MNPARTTIVRFKMYRFLMFIVIVIGHVLLTSVLPQVSKLDKNVLLLGVDEPVSDMVTF